MQLLFLGLLGACTLSFLMARKHQGRSLIGFFFALLFLGLLVHQAWWQIHGAGSDAFLHFRTHYDRRQHPHHGQLLDRHGIPLLLSPATFHLLGYDKKGATTGLQRLYRRRLTGSHLPQKEVLELLDRTPPQDITLTLDLGLQNAAYEALQGRPGAVIALDPRDGAIRALVSSPSLTIHELEEGITRPHAPQFNRATAGRYPPGSVFKLFTAALAIEHGKAQSRLCPASGWRPAPGTPPIRDTHRHREDTRLSISTAFVESSNIWFAKAAMDCGWEAWSAAFHRTYCDQSIPLAQDGDQTLRTVSGQLLAARHRKPAALAHPGFGQGDLLLTPMHIALLTASIANEGLMALPYLEQGTATPPLRVWEKATAQNVKALMVASVQSGTSRNVQLPGLAIGGKTGTAECANQPSHSWFTCFAPQDNPQIVLTVLVEHGGYGATTALPIAKTLLEYLQAQGRL